MGKWKCLDCGYEFSASEGGGWLFSLYRCVKCDRTKQVTIRNEMGGPLMPVDYKEISTCKWCGGELRDDIGPMCRKCKNRNTEQIEITVFYD
ncbi:MAG: hypothetical protein PHY18_01130 [Dehalococcoidales bacterium]|nr:hypothetical protein [Dehalococcoidales bacterium]